MLPTKILAIGAGGLQRALTHEFVHILNQRNLYGGGIFVGQPPRHRESRCLQPTRWRIPCCHVRL